MANDSPWLTVTEAAAYLRLGRRFVRRAIAQGRLRAAVVGGKRQVLTCTAWCDQFVSDQATPIAMSERRRA